MNRLEQRYKEQVVPALMKQFQYSSIMQAPKIEKVRSEERRVGKEC